MTKVIVDQAVCALLAPLKESVDLCDARGQVLGQFTPAASRLVADPMQPQVSEEELDRREREAGGRPLSEILADLEKRG